MMTASSEGGTTTITSQHTDGAVEISPVARVPWADVEQVFGERGDPARCWCQWFKAPRTEWQAGDRDAFRAALHDQVTTRGPGPGVVAHADGRPVGWCAVEPRAAYPMLGRGRLLRPWITEHDEGGVWAVTCFVVPVAARRQGVATALLRGAIEHARQHGARVLEAYPVDPGAKERVSAAELYHGPLSLFLAAGFTEVARPSGSRAVVRLELGSD